MTPEQYWEGDAALPIFYRQVEKERQERQFRDMNYAAWLQGKYFADAIAANFSKNDHYPEEPYGEEEIRERKRLEAMTDAEREREEIEKMKRNILQYQK